jgi:hypothetical protein
LSIVAAVGRTEVKGPIFVLLLLALLGAAAFLANRRLPLVRNSLVYASASRHVIEHGYDPRPVVADSALSYDKPILYAWTSAPFVERFGAHDGLRITSWLGTFAYLLAVAYFSRAFLGRVSGTFLLLAGLGPCVVYQFWSAHPDGCFAALVVLSWALAERIVAEPSTRPVRRMLLLGAVIYAAILLKNYGLILLISIPLYFLARRSTPPRRTLLAAIAVFVVLGGLVLLAWTGHHPLSRLEGEGGGVGQYNRGVFWTSAKGTFVQLGIALLLQFHVALAFAARRSSWVRGTIVPLVCFGGVYVAGLIPFPTTFYNMRYFVPLFPLVALLLLRGADAFGKVPRAALLGVHATIASVLVLVFDWGPAYRAAEPAIPSLTVNWIGTPLSLLDNLRMRLHLEQAAVLENIDGAVPSGAVLYMMDVGYYGDAQHGVYERDGLIRADITTRYVSSRDFHPEESAFYVYGSRGRPRVLDGFGKVTELGGSLFRVES